MKNRVIEAVRTGLHAVGLDLRTIPHARDESFYAGYPRESLVEKCFYNIGAGDFDHRYWTNIDYHTNWYADRQYRPFINHNLMELQPLPLPDDSAELFYSSHTIEHISDEAVSVLLQECHRTLKPGGGLRITCPDAALCYRSQEINCRAFWHWRFNDSNVRPHLDELTILDFVAKEVASLRYRFNEHQSDPLSPGQLLERFKSLSYVEFFNDLTGACRFNAENPGYHINWWDANKLISALRRAGFREATLSPYGQSSFAPFLNIAKFDRVFPSVSLYVEATK